MFKLHTQLSTDTRLIGELPLSRVLLMNDSNYPWVILVPRVQDVTEIFQLSETKQNQLAKESAFLSQTMAEFFLADKMNIAALGNMVPQLHLHHIARFKVDPCWPKPVWGVEEMIVYSDIDLEKQIADIRKILLPIGLEF